MLELNSVRSDCFDSKDFLLISTFLHNKYSHRRYKLITLISKGTERLKYFQFPLISSGYLNPKHYPIHIVWIQMTLLLEDHQ